MNAYITADYVKVPTGGGTVTYHESEALKSLGGEFNLISREQMENIDLTGMLQADEPWKWDSIAYHSFGNNVKFAHLYAGTFTDTVKKLKANGAKVVYTTAAHDVEKSRAEHKKRGTPFNYPHLVDPALWDRYVGGYLLADVLVCPSTHSEKVMKAFGYKGPVHVIPHGVDIPEKFDPFPSDFRLGYLGAIGPDKGIHYLLEAWSKLNMPDATLVLAGQHSDSPYIQKLLEFYGIKNVQLMGWLKDVKDFYNNITVYCQPSVTEGYGCEVPEAMSYGRPVICSQGAGAHDILYNCYFQAGWSVEAGNVDMLRQAISIAYANPRECVKRGVMARTVVKGYTWDVVRKMYIDLWKSVLTEEKKS